MARRRPDLTSAEAGVIHRVHGFFVEEKHERSKIHGNEPAKRTALACGVSERTVYNVQQRRAQGGPPPKRGGSRALVIDNFFRTAIRERIRWFYLRRELPTLSKVLRDCKENIQDFPDIGRTTLSMHLRNMGFKYTKRTGKRQLYERADVIASRAEYLRAVREYRADGRPIVFLDETWCNQHHTVGRAWQDNEVSPRDAPSGKGKRLIILHAGSRQGWVPEAGLVFVGKVGSADYHDEMNQTHFEDWWTHQLLPNLPPASVVVLDNAPYHNRRTEDTIAPTSASKKADIIAWLAARNIPHTPTSLKSVLYMLVKQHKPKPRYIVDQLAADQGVDVLRSPVGHCELNPIELVWARVKGHVAKHNSTYRMDDVKRLVQDGFDSVTPEVWAKCCDHVVKVEEEFWNSDALQEETVEALIIEIPGEESDMSEDDYSAGEASDSDSN